MLYSIIPTETSVVLYPVCISYEKVSLLHFVWVRGSKEQCIGHTALFLNDCDDNCASCN